jgi:hypothetical protein
MVLLTIGVFWYGISPTTVFISPPGKLSEPRFDSIRPRIELAIRATVIAFGLATTIVLTLPLFVDLVEYANGYEAQRISAVAESETRPLMGVSYLFQSVQIFDHGEAKYYHIMYSTEPIEAGRSYRFTVLSRSHMILDFQPTTAPTLTNQSGARD